MTIKPTPAILATIFALALISCDGGPSQTDEDAIAAVLRDAAALISSGDVDGFLRLQCPAARKEVADYPAGRDGLKTTYKGVTVKEFKDIEVTGDTATARVAYEKKGDPNFPSEFDTAKLSRVDGHWAMC